MFVSRQQYPRTMKVAVIREIDSGKSTSGVARNYQLNPKRLQVWKGEWRAKGDLAFPRNRTRPQGKLDGREQQSQKS
jgi:transposase